MATITDLNFQVILKGQTEFDKQLKAIEDRAKAFNITVSEYLELTKSKQGAKNIKEITDALREATKAQKELNDEVKKSPAEKITVKHRDAVTATNAKLYDTARVLRTIGTLTGGAFSIYGLRRFLSTLIEVTGQFEVQKMALRTMLQDIDAADKIFKDLYRFSSDSTYRFSELAKYSKQLAAFNIGKDSLLETTKMLGDVASGVGVSMDRIILAYGHVKSSGFLRGIQLRSFAQNGVPVLDELAKMFSELEHRAVSLGEVFDKMTRREIPFEMVEQAFKNMTSEGGKFYKMQEVLSKTLAGQINILKGRWENLMYAIGQSQEGLLKGTVSSISNLIANYEEFGKVVRQAVLVLGIYKATLLGIEVATNTFVWTNHKLLNSFKNIGKWIATNPYAMLAAGVAAVTFAVLRMNSQLTEAEKQQRNVDNAVKDFNANIAKETSLLDYYWQKLQHATVGTKEYQSAKDEIVKNYGKYLDAIDQENLRIGDTIVVYNKLREAIIAANREKAMEEGSANIGKTFTDAYNDADKALQKIFKHNKVDEGVQKEIYDYVYGRNGVNLLSLSPAAADYIKRMQDKAVTEIEIGPNGQKMRFNNPYGGDITEIEKQFRQASLASEKAYKDLGDRLDLLFGAGEGPDGGDTGEQLYKISSIVEAIKKVDNEIDAIRSKAKKGSITAEEKERLDTLVKEREAAAKEYKDIMGVDYDKSVKADSRAYDQAQQERIKALNKEASVIRKYKDVYDSLRPYLNEEQTSSALEHLFGIKFSNTDFDTQLDRLIVKLAELGDEGQQAADSLRASLGKDTAQDLRKSLEAQDKATEMLSDYLKKDFSIEGEGVAAQISKILVDLTNKNLKADEKLEDFIKQLDKEEVAKRLELLMQHSGEFSALRGLGLLDDKGQEELVDAYWKKWREEQIKAWKEKMKQEKEANKKLSDEQIVGKADEIFKIQTGGLDLTNFNDKTISQLRAIRHELLQMTFPAAIAEAIDDPVVLERLSEALAALQGNALKKLDLVISEKNVQAAKRLATAFFGIGDALSNAGETLDNDVLTGMGKMVSVAEQVTSAIAENETLMKSITGETSNLAEEGSNLAKSADWITMIVKLVLIVINQIVDVLGQAKEETLALKQAAIEAREALFNQNMADGVESVFGSNLTRQIHNANTELEKLRANMRMMSGGATLSKMASQHALFKKSGLFNMGHTPFTLNDAAYAAGLSVIDEKYGILNKDLLEIILNNYNLEEESRIWLESALTDVENYIEAMETLKDVMGDVMGNIAESAADTIVDTWVEAGNAALDYADILDDVAKSYAKMLIQSAILDDVLNEDEVNRVLALFARGDHKEAMAAIAGDMEKIADMEPLFASILEAFDPYFNREGSDNTLANGIKGITEDTANLLASYLNAIRADVAMMRSLAQGGWSKVDEIAAAIEVLPTLNDYIVKIEAHNANIEQNTHQILVELQGVIVNEGNGRGFRSYPA